MLLGEETTAPVEIDLALTVNEKAPGIVGTPLSKPAELNERPGGRDPLELQVEPPSCTGLTLNWTE